MPVNRRITLAARPVGLPQDSDFALDEVEVGSPQMGEALVRVLWASVDDVDGIWRVHNDSIRALCSGRYPPREIAAWR